MSLNFSPIPPLTAELAALECLKNQHIILLGLALYCLDVIFALFLIGSSSFLQVTKTTIKTGMSSNFDQIGLLTVELAALQRLEKSLYTYNGGNGVTTLLPSF